MAIQGTKTKKMKKQTFIELVNNLKKTEKETESFNNLKIDILETELVSTLLNTQDLLIDEILTSEQLDYFNWWVYENNFGNGLWNSGNPAKYLIDNNPVYTGTNVEMVYETMIKI